MSLNKQSQIMTDLLAVFKNNNFSYSWHTVKVGWELGYIYANDISTFALQYAENNPNDINMYISEVIFGVSDNEIRHYLNKIFDSLNIPKVQKGHSTWNQEWRKWRYYILQKKIKNMENDEDIVMKTDEVCADFGYPQDMKSLIYYMPPDKKEKHNDPSQSKANLVKKIKTFLDTEKNKILAGINTLPHQLYEDD